jgi:hypothetical protein
MANLKVDLLNKLKNDKYYDEMELVRLASDPNMNYKRKIDEMDSSLTKIALLNAKMGLVEQYFQDAPPQNQQAPAQAPAPNNVHQGQTHGE